MLGACVRKWGLMVTLTMAVLTVEAAWTPPLCDRAEVLRSAPAVTVKAYPDADSVLLADTEAARYNPDGTAEETDDCYEKILTQKGKDDRDSLDFHYTLPYGTVTVEKVEVIRQGTVIPVDIANQSRTQVEPGQMGSNIYNPNSKVTVVQIPDLQPGDILHYFTRQHKLKPYIPNAFSEYYVLQSTNPILDYRVVVDAPASLPLRSMVVKDEVKNSITSSVTKTADRVIYEWRARRVPRVFGEPGMPPLFTVVQRLLVSTTPEWKDISQWYWKLCLPHLEKTTPAMVAQVKALTADLKTDDARIRAIYYYVAHQIRYMGLTTETDAPGYEPHDVNITFDNKYGVCRDKAALLAAMLRLAGFNARPVLFFVGPKKDVEVPNNYFNHAIVAVEKKPGDYLLMDPTDENSRDLFPTYLCDKSYLVARPDGDPLRTSAVVPAERNLMRISTSGEVDAGGTLKASSQIGFDGVNDGVYRDAFLRWTPEKREEFFSSKLRQALPGATVRRVEILPRLLDDSSKPLEVRLVYEVPDFLIAGDAAAMVRLPWLGTQFGMVNFVIDNTSLDKRCFPMLIDTTCGVREKFELRLSGLSKPLLLPQYAPVKQPDFAWWQQVEWKKNVLSGESRFTLDTMEITVAGYAALKEQLRKMEYDRRKMPLFAAESLTRDADVLTLRHDVMVDVTSASSWTEREIVRKKILTYSGKKSASELKFEFNPAWSDFKLVRASVTAPQPQSRRQEVKPQEINLMDASWVGAAPRYPAAKIMVVSLPNVEPGSVIEYETLKTYRQRPFFSTYELFRGHDPLVIKQFQVTFPTTLPNLPRASAVPDRVRLVSHTAAQRTIWTWTAHAMAKVRDENRQPPLFSFCPAVLISNGDWPVYAEHLNRALTSAAAGQALTAAKARELAAGQKASEQIAAVNTYVLKNIRESEPNFTQLPLTCLSPADVTLKDGYGNTADRAIVLYAMLKELGLKPEFVVGGAMVPVEMLYRRFDDYPEPWLFDEVLVRVACDGEALYLNADNHYGRPGICQYDGYPALDLISGKMIRIELPERLRDGTVSDYRIDFDLDGNALITHHVSYYGSDYSEFRKKYSEMTPEKRRRFFLKEAAVIAEAAQVVTSEADVGSYPAVKKLTVKVPHYGVRDGRYLYFTLPGRQLQRLLPLGNVSRATPYFLDRFVNLRYKIAATVAGTPARVMMEPATWSWQAPDRNGRVDFAAAASGSGFTIDSTIALVPAVVPPYRFGEYLWVGDKLGSPALWQVTVELPPEKPAPVTL